MAIDFPGHRGIAAARVGGDMLALPAPMTLPAPASDTIAITVAPDTLTTPVPAAAARKSLAAQLSFKLMRIAGRLRKVTSKQKQLLKRRRNRLLRIRRRRQLRIRRRKLLR